MPHTSSAEAEAADTRRRYTGENRRQSLTAVRELGPDGPLIPEATSEAQRMLELSLLLTARYMNFLPADAAHGYVPYDSYPVIRSSSPRKSGMSIRLNPQYVRWYLSALIGPRYEHRWCAAWGLRLTTEKGRLVIRLLDEQSKLTDARVLLENVRAADWKDMLGEYGYDSLQRRTPELHPQERTEYARWAGLGPTDLGSAMLRRIGLVAHSVGANAWRDYGRSLVIEFKKRENFAYVATALGHPRAGILDDRYIVKSNDFGKCRIEATERSSTGQAHAMELVVVPSNKR